MPLPLNITDFLTARTVESDRIKFKTGWNLDAIYRSICAFANEHPETVIDNNRNAINFLKKSIQLWQ